MSANVALESVLRTIAWQQVYHHLVILHQTALPGERSEIPLYTMQHTLTAIQSLQVPGAPLIGVTAAFGLYLGMREALAKGGAESAVELSRCVST